MWKRGWLPATAHDWLESVGIIHAHGSHDTDHDAADGHCRLENGVVLLKAAPLLVAHPWLGQITVFSVVCLKSEPKCRQRLDHLSTAPPELQRTWQFIERAALPGRAPTHVA